MASETKEAKYPGFLQKIMDTKFGKKFEETVTDPARFLRVGVIVMAYLGVLTTGFDLWNNGNAGPSELRGDFFRDLFFTLLGVGVFYYMRTMVESRPKE